MSGKKSFVGKFFTKLNKNQVSCKVCEHEKLHTILQSCQSTTPMRNHLQSKHGITEEKEIAAAAATSNGTSNQPSASASNSTETLKRQLSPPPKVKQSQLSKFFKSEGSLDYYLLGKVGSQKSFRCQWNRRLRRTRIVLGISQFVNAEKQKDSVEAHWNVLRSCILRANRQHGSQVQHFIGRVDRHQFETIPDRVSALQSRALQSWTGSDSTGKLHKRSVERSRDCPSSNSKRQRWQSQWLTRFYNWRSQCRCEIAETIWVTGHALHLAVTDILYKKKMRKPKQGEKIDLLDHKQIFIFIFWYFSGRGRGRGE